MGEHTDDAAAERSVSGAPAAPDVAARPVRIAYQGEAGSNSDTACRQRYPEATAVGLRTFDEALDAVPAGLADLAMIPVDNSTAGRVADVHHLLPQSELFVIGEFFLPIHFQLVALPGVRPDEITTVRSHVHALGQCRELIRQHHWDSVVSDDTAGAAREVSELGDRHTAALAPLAAAQLYGLEVLAADVEDEHHNTTRFLVLAPERDDVGPGAGPAITSFLFRVRNVPSALYKALGGFATNGVNMTKLESYQLGGTFSATRFYADVEGHPTERPLANALAELQFFCSEVRMLGTYPADPYRDTFR